MLVNKIIEELDRNKDLFKTLLSNTPQEAYYWKPEAKKWCLLEVVCHLKDEEQEDFRARIKHLFSTPEQPLTPFDPSNWVIERKYIEQNFNDVLNTFLEQRTQSIDWLKSLKNPKWDNHQVHPTFGHRSAKMFLVNWLAHDYLHLRQITRLKYDYLNTTSSENLDYAGKW